MSYQRLLEGLARYDASAGDICLSSLGVPAEQVHERVILAPWWEPDYFDALGDEINYLCRSDRAFHKVWNIRKDALRFTYIKTGVGAPVLMDTVLALSLTDCKKAIFIGSVGALDARMSIGDIVIPEYSVCGDGASRYLTDKPLKDYDPFGEKSYPDPELYRLMHDIAERLCRESGVSFHTGKTFSIDTIFAQFARMDEILAMGCDTIEMETAAAFRAAKLAGVRLAALFSVSDNAAQRKTLISGRTEAEMALRREVRKTVIPKILLEALE